MIFRILWRSFRFVAIMKDDEIEIKKCYVAIGILDKKDLHCKKNTELFEFLRNFGRLIVRPYSFSEFDFGDEDKSDESDSDGGHEDYKPDSDSNTWNFACCKVQLYIYSVI